MSESSERIASPRNRDARLGRLRGLMPMTNAIVGVDLADAKHAEQRPIIPVG